MMIKYYLKGLKTPILALAVVLSPMVHLNAIPNSPVEFQGWGGVNIATKSTFSTDYTNATFVQPTFGLTTWFSQPFLLPNELDVGLSAGYQPVFSQTAGTGKITSVTSYPVILEARYRFPYGIFAAAGAGYAYTRLKINDESTGTNSMVLSAKGGYQYEIWKNLSAVATFQMSYLLQSITFAGAGEKSNSQLNLGFHLGVAYRL